MTRNNCRRCSYSLYPNIPYFYECLERKYRPSTPSHPTSTSRSVSNRSTPSLNAIFTVIYPEIMALLRDCYEAGECSLHFYLSSDAGEFCGQLQDRLLPNVAVPILLGEISNTYFNIELCQFVKNPAAATYKWKASWRLEQWARLPGEC